MMKRLFLILALLMISVSLVNAQSDLTSNDPPYYCPNKNGAFYQPNLFPRYDINTHSLVLIDATTNQPARTLDTFEDEVRIVNWSPDCRYLTGAVGNIGATNDYYPKEYGTYIRWSKRNIVLWDAVNGGRIQTVLNPAPYIDYVHPSPVVWSPDGNYALIMSGCTSVSYSCLRERTRYDFIWQRANNNSVRVGGFPVVQYKSSLGEIRYDLGFPDRSWFNQYYWDMQRGWLWGSSEGGVSAYDVNSGVEVRFFQNESWPESRFEFSPDDKKVIVYSLTQPGSRERAGITIYDIDSQEAIGVNVEGFAAHEIPSVDYHPVALSADNRYLAIGYDAIRVWDIQNLPEKFEDRLPIYRHAGPKALIWSLRFSADGVIETNSKDGIQHWDLHTGAFLPN